MKEDHEDRQDKDEGKMSLYACMHKIEIAPLCVSESQYISFFFTWNKADRKASRYRSSSTCFWMNRRGWMLSIYLDSSLEGFVYFQRNLRLVFFSCVM